MARIDCKEIANKEQELIKQEIGKLRERPQLATLMVGDNPASEVYVRNKHKVCDLVGIEAKTIRFDGTITMPELIDVIKGLNNNCNIHGILLQLPLPAHLDPDVLAMMIHPMKDVDGFHPYNQGLLMRGWKGNFPKPCTPAGVMKVFEHLEYNLEGREIAVIGRSNILGKPVAQMLMQAGATILQLHSKSPGSLFGHFETLCPEVIVSCVGKEDLFEYCDLDIPSLNIIVDCAILRGEDGKLRGDFKKEDYHYLDKDGIDYTPVPGGVGVLTTTMLARNVLECYKMVNDIG